MLYLSGFELYSRWVPLCCVTTLFDVFPDLLCLIHNKDSKLSETPVNVNNIELYYYIKACQHYLRASVTIHKHKIKFQKQVCL